MVRLEPLLSTRRLRRVARSPILQFPPGGGGGERSVTMRAPSAGARIVALLGLVVVCCIAAIICTVERVGQQREVLLQKGRRHARGRRSVAALDGNVFASPQDIYKQALDRFKRAEKSAISGDDALAWAHQIGSVV